LKSDKVQDSKTKSIVYGVQKNKKSVNITLQPLEIISLTIIEQILQLLQ